MVRSNIKRVLLSSVALLTLGLEREAQAQDQSQDQSEAASVALEEIIVTASKRGAQSLQDVPSAIQAFSADQIEALGANEFADLATRIPGLTFQDQGPGDREYIIRGVNSRGTATTGVYYDEAVITARNKQDGGGRQADIELHDLARVEVLKGPQGTLYGASSLSGTIRFIPNEPDATKFEGRVEGTASTTRKGEGNYHVDGMINVPIIKNVLALRTVGWVTRDGGFIDNVRLGLKDINSNDVEGIRVAAKWTPIEEFALTASFLVQDRAVGGSSRFNKGTLSESYRQRLINFDLGVFPVTDLSNQDFTVNNWDENLKLYSLKAEYDVGWGSFLATTNYLSRDIEFRFDSTPILLSFGVPIPAVTFQPQSRDQWSNEIRFASDFDGPFQFVAGAFYLEEDKDFEVQVIATNELGLPIGPFDVDDDGAAIFGRDKNDDFDQFAFFGEVTYDLSNDLQFIFGIRYFEADIASVARETKPFGGFPPTENPSLVIPPDTQSKTTFKIGANYHVMDDVLVYAQAASGFRIGGTNEDFINPGGADIPPTFDSDSLWNYEFGWKTSWYDDRLTFNGAVYFIRWKDIQIGNFDPDSPFPFIGNGGKASVDGIEVEVNARPIATVDLFFGASYQNARLTEDLSNEQGFKGDDIPNVPEFQANGGFRWIEPVHEDFSSVVQLDFSYQGERDTLFITDDDLNVNLDSYFLANAKIGVEGERWQAHLFVRNITDKRAEIDAVNTDQDPLAFLTVRPRTFGINVSTRF